MDEVQRESQSQYKQVAGSYQEGEDIIESYIQHLFVVQGDKDIFKRVAKYLDSHALIYLRAKIQYQNNILPLDRSTPEAIQAADQIISSPLATSTMIKLCSYNKPSFDLNEPIEVSIWVKNVP